MKSRLFVILVSVFLTTSVYADTANQTDWSGGPGEQGPVTVWDNSFLQAYRPSARVIFLPDERGRRHISMQTYCYRLISLCDNLTVRVRYSLD